MQTTSHPVWLKPTRSHQSPSFPSPRSPPPAEQQTWVICCWPLCTSVCVCVCPFASNRTDHLGAPWQTRSRLWPWLLHQPLILRLSVHLLPQSIHLSTFSPTAWLKPLSTCMCVCVCGLPWLWESACTCQGPLKVTPYVSCRDNEGFNFTTQAYQIAAPRSLWHAPTTWVIWMGRHPPFHVHWAVCVRVCVCVPASEDLPKGPHHHNRRPVRSGVSCLRLVRHLAARTLILQRRTVRCCTLFTNCYGSRRWGGVGWGGEKRWRCMCNLGT